MSDFEVLTPGFGGFAERVGDYDAFEAGASQVEESFAGLFRAPALERIALIKHGVRAQDAKILLAELPIGQMAALKALNLPVATVNRKAKQDEMLATDESERVIGLARLIGQVQAMVEESGDPAGFDAREWLGRWLSEALPALGGRRPLDLLDTMEGQNLVSGMLAMVQSGAYA